MSATARTDAAVPSLAALRDALERVGQGHLLRFHDDLSPERQAALRRQIASLPLSEVPALVEGYVLNKPAFASPAELTPAPFYPDDRDKPVSLWGRERYRALGEEMVRAGKVAAFTVAGGQGTRLGFDGPKGCYPAGAVTGKPLFRMLAESILASEERFGAHIPWAIMTSPHNHEATVSFFEEHRHFGLDPSRVVFFPQGVLPSFDMRTGKILLSAKDEVATNPDGHGGALRALRRSGTLESLQSRGVEHLCYTQIDNPLVRVVDPVFLGLHAHAPDSSGEMSSKMVTKANAGEKVGVFCQSAGRTMIIEYSDMPESLSHATDRDGSLMFRAGNIAVHALSLAFVDRLTKEGGAEALPYHRAEKKVPFVDLDSGQRVEPASPNAVKLEMFAFDAIPMCAKSLVLETQRVEEFAPIKNASGVDSPESCAQIQTERAARWLEAAGVKVPRRPDGAPDCTLEISARTALDAQELAKAKNLPKSIERGESLAL